MNQEHEKTKAVLGFAAAPLVSVILSTLMVFAFKADHHGISMPPPTKPKGKKISKAINLELRVKTTNKVEAISQQRLAAAEAEIAELRQKLEASKRNTFRLTDVLKSKNEENETYLFEIESIGQAYDDM